MARKPGFTLPGIPQHIIQRGNNREHCFYSVDDCARFLGDLKNATEMCYLTPIYVVLL